VIDEGIPRVCKLDKPASISQEFQGAKALQNLIGHDALTSKPVTSKNRTRSGLMYAHAGSEDSKKARKCMELEDIIMRKSVTTGANAMTKLYDWLARQMHKPAKTDRRDKQLFSLYTEKGYDYLRSRAPRYQSESACARISDILAGAATFLSDPILDPNIVVEKLRHVRLPYTVGPVHGDLHPRNVIFDDTLTHPHLIDFKWSRQESHVLLDYVLMEISLRFLWIPRGYDPVTEAHVNRLLVRRSGEVTCRRHQYLPHRRHYKRLALLLPIIRDSARKVTRTGEDWYSEYLVAFFLVLYGLLNYSSYDGRSATHALGLVGHRLRELGVIADP
jgi:hypothetical protein